MKRPSGMFLLAMSLLIAAGGATAWTWRKLGSLPPAVLAQRDFRKALSYREPVKFAPLTEAERTRQRQLARESKARMLARYPQLSIEPSPVPDEQNGFLQMHELGEDLKGGKLSFSQPLQDLLASGELPAAATAAAVLAENAELIARIERIAALPAAFSTHMPESYAGGVNAREALQAGRVLLLKARLAAREGNGDEVFRLVGATRNLARHFHNLDNPSLIARTVGLVLERDCREAVQTHLVPAFTQPADLDRWSELLVPEEFSPAELGRSLREEWHHLADRWLWVMNPRDPDCPPDPDVLAEAFAHDFNDMVVRLTDPATDYSALMDMPETINGTHPELSPEGVRFMKQMSIGVRPYGRSFATQTTEGHQQLAAIQLLRHECSGTPLTAALCESVARDPVTGKAFVLNPATRELAPPEGANKHIKPLTLPPLSGLGFHPR